MLKRRNKRTRAETIYVLALAGISTAVALLLVWLSVLVRFSTIAFFVAAGCALMVPISRKYYLSAIFAYIVSSLLAFAIVGDIFAIVGYVAYFGPMSIATAILNDKKVKQYISIPLKVLYINGALALMYFVCGTVMIDSAIIGQIHYAIVALVGTIGLLIVDIVMQMVYRQIIPAVSRVIRQKSSRANGEPPRDGATDDENDSEDENDNIDNANPFE